MRILVNSAIAVPLSPNGQYYGCERLSYEYALKFKEFGHSVSFVAVEGSSLPEGIELIPAIQNNEKDSYTRYASRLKEFDVILDLSHQHWPAMNMDGLPVVNIFWHDPYLAKFPEPKYNVIAISQYAKRVFEEVYKQEAYYQETIEVDPEVYQLGYGNSNRFLAVGKMSQEKGNLEAIRLARKLGVSLDVVGGRMPTDPDEYEALVKFLAYGNIKCWGNTTDQAKITLMQNARALIYPVYQLEIHSHKSVEAMMCGCPVITYNFGAMSEVIKDSYGGFVVNSEEEFLWAMDRTLDREKVRQYAVDRWAVDKIVKNYLVLLEEVVSGRRW